MRKNKGYSLIELVVVIALLAILSTIVVSSIMSINTSEASKCVSNINSLVTKGKVNSMSRATDVVVVIRFDGTNFLGEYYEGTHLVSTEVMGSSRVAVTYTTDDGTVVDLGDTTKKLYISFVRDTAALKTLGAAATVTGVVSTDSRYLETITVTANSRAQTITFIQPTGKHFY